MKNLKKDNKGFSLVELIVVVLIMAIIAVALAPQILKWVNNSRISADNDTMQQLVSNCQTTLTNEAAFEDKVSSISVGNSGITTTIEDNDFWNKLAEYTGVARGSLSTAYKTKVSGETITITIGAKGAVTGSYSGDTVDN